MSDPVVDGEGAGAVDGDPTADAGTDPAGVVDAESRPPRPSVGEATSLSAVRAGLPRSRREAEAWLDALVDGNRFTIAVFFPLVGALLLLGSAQGWPIVPDALRFNPPLLLFGTAVMAAPLAVGVLPAIDRRAAAGLGVLAAYTYLVEAVGVATGWPYGEFAYGVSLGPMLGGIPAALPVFFLPIVLNAYVLCVLVLGERAAARRWRLGVVIPTVVTMDVVLDPAAVSLGFWSYAADGALYGVPLSNYAGWVVSATVAVVVLDATIDRDALDRRLAACPFLLDDLVSFVILWGAINAFYANWLSALVAVGFGLVILRLKRFDADLLRPATGLSVPRIDREG